MTEPEYPVLQYNSDLVFEAATDYLLSVKQGKPQIRPKEYYLNKDRIWEDNVLQVVKYIEWLREGRELPDWAKL